MSEIIEVNGEQYSKQWTLTHAEAGPDNFEVTWFESTKSQKLRLSSALDNTNNDDTNPFLPDKDCKHCPHRSKRQLVPVFIEKLQLEFYAIQLLDLFNKFAEQGILIPNSLRLCYLYFCDRLGNCEPLTTRSPLNTTISEPELQKITHNQHLILIEKPATPGVEYSGLPDSGGTPRDIVGDLSSL